MVGWVLVVDIVCRLLTGMGTWYIVYSGCFGKRVTWFDTR